LVCSLAYPQHVSPFGQYSVPSKQHDPPSGKQRPWHITQGAGVAGGGMGGMGRDVNGGLGVPHVPSPVQFPGAQHDLRCPSSDTQHSRDAGHTKSLVAAPQHWLSRGL